MNLDNASRHTVLYFSLRCQPSTWYNLFLSIYDFTASGKRFFMSCRALSCFRTWVDEMGQEGSFRRKRVFPAFSRISFFLIRPRSRARRVTGSAWTGRFNFSNCRKENPSRETTTKWHILMSRSASLQLSISRKASIPRIKNISASGYCRLKTSNVSMA